MNTTKGENNFKWKETMRAIPTGTLRLLFPRKQATGPARTDLFLRQSLLLTALYSDSIERKRIE